MKRDGLLKAGSITLAGLLFGATSTFVLTGMVGNTTGAAGTGLFFQAVAFFTIAASTLQLGADTALVRSLSRDVALGQTERLRPTVIVAMVPVLTVASLFGIVLFLGADPIAHLLASDGDEDRLGASLRVLAPFCAAGAALAVVLGGTRGLGGVLPYTMLQNVLLPGLRLVVVGTALAAGAGLEQLIGLWAAPVPFLAAAGGAILVVRLRTQRAGAARNRPQSLTEAAPALWRFALPRGIATTIEKLLDWSGVFITIAIAGPAVGGVYAVVTRIVTVGPMIEQAMRVTLGPKVSEALAMHRTADSERLLGVSTKAVVLVSWPFHLLSALFAPSVLTLFGSEFSSGAAALVVLHIACMLTSLANMQQSVLLMGGRSSWQLANRVAQLTLLLGLSFALVPQLGSLGAALAWAAAMVLDAGLVTVQVRGFMRIRMSLRSVLACAALPALVFGGGGALLAMLLPPYALAPVLASGVLAPLYLGLIALGRHRAAGTRTARTVSETGTVIPALAPLGREPQ